MGGKGALPFDPTSIKPEAWQYVFIGVRVFGAVVVVAFMEEIFWRGFLIRWIDGKDFKRVPIGVCSWKSFGITVVLFGFEHEQWLAGMVCGALYNWLYRRRKDLFSCVLAHATSNAALAAWVLWRGDWKFW
jgi:CAAX prenyl protease-like protein